MEVEEWWTGTTLEQLNAPSVDAERAPGARRGYGVFHCVGNIDARQTTGDLLSRLGVAPTISQGVRRDRRPPARAVAANARPGYTALEARGDPPNR